MNHQSQMVVYTDVSLSMSNVLSYDSTSWYNKSNQKDRGVG